VSIFHKNIECSAAARCLSVVFLAVTAFFCFPVYGQQEGPTEQYALAIESARQGDTGAALILLKGLLDEAPTNSQYRYDYVTVLVWAGQDRAAYGQTSELDLTIAPFYVLESLAKSARNIQDYGAAQRLYRTVLVRDVRRTQSRVGLALSLADAGRGGEALAELELASQYGALSNELREARDYVKDSMRDPIDAALVREAAVKSGSLPVTALRNYILDISRRGAPQMALAMAQRNPGAITELDISQIKGDEAAAYVRWGKFDLVEPADRYRHTDIAIQLLTDELARLKDKNSDQANRIYFDLLVAYRDRQELNKAVEVYASLDQRGVDFPPYVLHTMGDIYLALRQPERALSMLRASLVADPHNLGAQVSLFYALLDLGRHEEAVAYIDTTAADQPAWVEPLGGGPLVWNREKTQMQVATSLARAFVGDLAQGQARLEVLQARSPNNIDINNDLAHVHLWRGWPRLAMSEFAAIKTMEPDFLPALLGTISANYALGDVAAAEALLRQIPEVYVADASVLRRKRELDIYRMRELSITSSGGQITSYHDGSSDFTVEGHYYDAYFTDSWRPFAHLIYQQGDLSGVAVDYQQWGAGLNYGGRNLSGNIELTRNSHQNTGVRLDGRWAINDYVSVYAAADSHSRDTPLKARIAHVESASSTIGSKYRFHEGRDLNAGLGFQRFDDGNMRLSMYFSGREVLITQPKYSVEMGMYLYQQKNDDVNADYFNPAKISSAELSLMNEWRNYRRYDYGFSQRLRSSLGSVKQDGFAPGLVWGLSYEHVWNLGDRCSFNYGLSYGMSLYDGVSEKQGRGFLALNKRF